MSTSCPVGRKEYSRLLVGLACYLARKKRRISDGKSSRLRSFSAGRTSPGSPGGVAPIFELRSLACIINWSMKSPKPSFSYSKTNDELLLGLRDFEACFGELQSHRRSFICEARMAQLGNQTI